MIWSKEDDEIIICCRGSHIFKSEVEEDPIYSEIAEIQHARSK
jgi:hypothetical protein